MTAFRSVDVKIAVALLQGLKTSWDGHQFGKVVGVGHGYGRFSVPLARSFLASPKYNSLLGGMVLMSSAPGVPSLLTSFGRHITMSLVCFTVVFFFFFFFLSSITNFLYLYIGSSNLLINEHQRPSCHPSVRPY